MSVFKRKMPNGNETKEYHYKFMKDGTTYSGVCKGCTTKRDAEVFEKDIKAKITELSKQKSVKALVENYKNVLTGGTEIKLSEAFEMAVAWLNRYNRE